MYSLIVQNDNPLKAWKNVIENFKNHVPMYIETDLNNLDLESPLFVRYQNEYKWHFRDSYRSLITKMERTLTPYEFSYYSRIHDYFGIDQLETVIEHPNNLICTWDPQNDYKKSPRPCLATLKLIPEGHFLHISVSFRMRDVIKRLYPNWIALGMLQQEIAIKLGKNVGKLFDYSNQIMANQNELEKILKWPEFGGY